MKRSFKNLFMIIVILATTIASGLRVAPAYALGPMVLENNLPAALPIPPGESSPLQYGYLNGIWGYGTGSAQKVFAVGYGNTGGASPKDKPIIYKKASDTWTAVSPPLPSGFGSPWGTGSLSAVWGTSDTNVYAVGVGGVNTLTLPLLFQYNGTDWSTSNPGLAEGETGQLQGVWGSGDSDIYLVGYVNSTGGSNWPLVLHGHDTTWERIALAPPSGYAQASITDIWGTGSTNFYLVGYGQFSSSNKPVIYHYFNGSWETITPDPPPGWSSGILNGIWGSASNDIYAVGEGINAGNNRPLIYHWNGSTWQRITPSLPTPSWSWAKLQDVWGASASEVYAVGWGYNSGARETAPVLYHKTDTGWAAASYPLLGWANGFYYSIWGSGTDDVYAAGNGRNNSTSSDRPRIDHAGVDGTSPGPVAVDASPGVKRGSVDLEWAAASDDGNPNSGPVASYLVKYTDTEGAITTCDGPDGIPVTEGVPDPLLPGTPQTMTIFDLTPGKTYWFLVCGKDENNNLSPLPATLAMTTASMNAAYYDDTDPLWVYSTGWTTTTTSGPYNNTLHRTNVNGKTATFIFQGPSYFTFYYRMGPSRGTFEIWVDGELLKTINAYSTTNVWQKKYNSPAYTGSGDHTVLIKNIAPNGTYIDVDAIRVSPAPLPSSEGMYDDVELAWVYSAGWTANTPSGAYGGTNHYTSTTGATAMFVVQAPAFFRLYYRTGPNRGSFTISVDGVKLATINAYSTTTKWQKTYTSPAYTDGEIHTIVIKNTSPTGTYIDVDAMQVITAPAPSGLGIYDDVLDTLWVYSPNWEAVSAASAYAGTIHRTSTKGSTAMFVFQAPARFIFYYRTGTSRGPFTISVDGVKIASINAYSTTTVWQKKYTSPAYTDDKAHTIVIRDTSPTGTYIDVDAIEIISP